MYHLSSIKQVEEKNLASEVELMLWSDRMDIVALANVKGEVALHRLSWTRAWILSPNKEGERVKSLSWRPDGKVLAIAYSSGEVLLVNVENKMKLQLLNITGDVTCMFWIQEKPKASDSSFLLSDEVEENEYLKHIDHSTLYLPEIKAIGTYTAAAGNDDDSKVNNLLQNQTDFNLLAIGTKGGHLHLNVFGSFTCAILDMNEYIGCECSLVNVGFSENLDTLFVTVKDVGDELKIIVINSAVFKTHTREIFAVASKHERLYTLLDYLSGTITTITESWENILMEMDTKLSKYAAKVPEGGVTADFLDLLMFGICSNELEEFLVHDLTKKGLEKFGQTIEISYANIQKLLLKYVMKTGQNITYHLAELRGCARMAHKYDIFGLHEDLITQAINANGAFLIKSGEMQQIINHSLINYKAFFRWLYTSIMHLIEEPVPPEITKMTQQDLANIAEFLQNFDKIDSSNKSGFVMERLGQYLSDYSLKIPACEDENEWQNFLKQNNCVREHPEIFHHYKDKSLVEQLKDLKTSIHDIFRKSKDLIKPQFTLKGVVNCFECCESSIGTSQWSLCTKSVLFGFAYPTSRERICLIDMKTDDEGIRAGYFYFSQGGENHKIVDVSFYSKSILSILLQGSSSAMIAQFNVALTLEKLARVDTGTKIGEQNLPVYNGFDFLVVFKTIEYMDVSQFSVSGSRKVSIVLSENRRKIRIFEMEAEDEDEEDVDATVSTVKDSDVSMQDTDD